jgi:N-acetylneuraminic acid mutarotase
MEWTSYSDTGLDPRAWHTGNTIGNKALFFGGASYSRLRTSKCYNEIVVYDPELMTFSPVTTSGEVPPPRASHTSTLYQSDKIFVHGGERRDNGELPRYHQDVYTFDATEIRWQKQSVRGTLPERECHSASAIDNKRIYIFGGATYDGTYHYYDDTTLVDTVSMQSFKVETRGEVPESRAGHSATVLPNGKIFLFGGEGVVDGCYFNDSFTFDPANNTWSKVASSGRIPPARAGHSAVLLGNKLYIYGGYNSNGTKFFYFSDMYRLDIRSMEWEKVDNIIGPSPAEMSSHAATAIDEHKMIIFGGTKDNVFYNNAFVLDTQVSLKKLCMAQVAKNRTLTKTVNRQNVLPCDLKDEFSQYYVKYYNLPIDSKTRSRSNSCSSASSLSEISWISSEDESMGFDSDSDIYMEDIPGNYNDPLGDLFEHRPIEVEGHSWW